LWRVSSKAEDAIVGLAVDDLTPEAIARHRLRVKRSSLCIAFVEIITVALRLASIANNTVADCGIAIGRRHAGGGRGKCGMSGIAGTQYLAVAVQLTIRAYVADARRWLAQPGAGAGLFGGPKSARTRL
jgi:hypothetical protein